MKSASGILPSVILGLILGVFVCLLLFDFVFTTKTFNYQQVIATTSNHFPAVYKDSSLAAALPQGPAIASLLPKTVVSPINGLKISEERAKLPVLAVMVENLSPARQQSSLSKADIVYEALVEAGITRFMALFQGNEADVVGPVRSARTYFAEIAGEYDAWYAHVGGNADALQFIARQRLHNLDQFLFGKPYWRDPVRQKRGLEHSMYTDTVELRSLVSGSLSDTFAPWKFKNTETAAELSSPKQKIEIDFSSPVFKVRWDYDAISNSYSRSLGDLPHKDAQNGQILGAKNIIIQYVKTARVPNPPHGDEGALKMQLTGEGAGFLFRDGRSFPVRWRKQNSGERTRYFDENGEEIVLNPGVIWVELLEDKSRVDVIND